MGHDLKGAIHYFKCAIPDLHFALAAVIDYKGFRMHAQVRMDVYSTKSFVIRCIPHQVIWFVSIGLYTAPSHLGVYPPVCIPHQDLGCRVRDVFSP
jgi:hypothetical protein